MGRKAKKEKRETQQEMIDEFLHLHIIHTSKGRFVVYFDEFPEVTAQGKTESEARKLLQKGLMKLMKENKIEKLKKFLPE